MKRILTTAVYDKWVSRLKDRRVVALIRERLLRLAGGNPGFGKYFGKIGELKIDYGPGYRVYYHDTGREIIVLLCGGDKTTQKRDINKAWKLVEIYERGE